MTILVTGASGFLGGRLTQILVERGNTVRVFARRTSDVSHLPQDKIEVIRGSLTDPEILAKACDGVSYIYHCAGMSADWGDWDEFASTNIDGTQSLLAAARDAGTLKRFLHVSTTDVYGYPEQACEESYGIRDIGLFYNKSKGLGEKSVWQIHESSGTPVTIIRPVSIYGPRSKDFVVEIAQLLKEGSMMLVNGGNNPAGLLYVDNAVDGLIAAATSEDTIGKVYNLRDETETTWKQYCNDLARELGMKPPWLNIPERVALLLGRGMETIWGSLKIKDRPLLTRHAVYLLSRDQSYSITRAKRDFGFQSKISYEEGLSRCVTWLNSAEGRKILPR
jgi:nucleoside-diphosphate-sugar epimerase